jgi:predicted MFS family arabinose efflux permease
VTCVPKGLLGAPVDLRTWAALGRNRMVLLLLLITMLQVSGQFCVFTYLGPLMSRLTAASPETIGVAFALFGVAGFVGNILAMRIVGTIGSFRTSAFYLVILLLGSSVWIAGAGLLSLPVLLAASATWGFAFAAMNSMQQTRLVAAAPEFAGASVALNTSVLYVGQAVGSGLGGLFFARNELAGNGYGAAAFLAPAVVVLMLTRPSAATA